MGYFGGGGGGSDNITPGTTTITGGTNTRVLFDNAGVIGESANATIVAGVPTFVAPVLGAATGTSLALGGTLTANYTLDVASTSNTGRGLVRTSDATSVSLWEAQNSTGSSAYGLFEVFGGSNGATIFGASTNHLMAIRAGGANISGLVVGTDTSDPLILGTNNTARLTIGATGSLTVERTITAGGTTGAQTINKMAGTVNFAASATTLVVTNSLVDTSSIIFAVIRTNDATATIKNVVPGSGSFTITLTAAATAETSVGFWVTN